jgi:hypothetical protein
MGTATFFLLVYWVLDSRFWLLEGLEMEDEGLASIATPLRGSGGESTGMRNER